MKTSFLLPALAAYGALAFPSMDRTMAEIESRQAGPSTEMIGDLATLPDDKLTGTGKDIKAILSGGGNAQDMFTIYRDVPAKDTDACKADTCCIWKYIADEMRAAMTGSARRCNNLARAAVRLGFHDAASWSKSTGGTGADGSVVLTDECKSRIENNGLHEVCDQMQTWFDKYKPYGVSMADLIQMGANVATVVCPLGPRIKTYVGRKDSTTPSVEGLIPSPFDSADSTITLFADKTFTPAGLVALIGAHTTSQQRFVDTNRAGDPQDTTPGVWDVAYYGQTLDPNAPSRVFKFQSDINLAQDPRTSGFYKQFSGQMSGQIAWNKAYASEYVRMSLLGVNNINSLTDCTKVLPSFRTSFFQPDQRLLEQWIKGGINSAKDALFNGDIIPSNAQ